jgi:hypothetical protein
VAKDFDVEVLTITKNEAGENAKAPAVYLNDLLLCEVGGIRDGKITEAELFDELSSARVPRKQRGSCSSCCS